MKDKVNVPFFLFFSPFFGNVTESGVDLSRGQNWKWESIVRYAEFGDSAGIRIELGEDQESEMREGFR